MDFDKIKYTHMTVAVGCVALCCSGMLIIWQFQPELFFSLDVVRFILWAYALSLPWFFVHWVVCAAEIRHESKDVESFKLFTLSAIFTSIGIAGAVLLCRFLNMGLAQFWGVAGIWHMAVGAIAHFSSKETAKSQDPSSPETPVSDLPAPDTRTRPDLHAEAREQPPV